MRGRNPSLFCWANAMKSDTAIQKEKPRSIISEANHVKGGTLFLHALMFSGEESRISNSQIPG